MTSCLVPFPILRSIAIAIAAALLGEHGLQDQWSDRDKIFALATRKRCRPDSTPLEIISPRSGPTSLGVVSPFFE